MPIYPQYNPSACTSCQECLNLCPKGCIYFDPLFIDSDECILCDQCLPACPEGELVLAADSKLRGKEWVWFVQPQEPSTDDNTSENPSKPSNPSDKDSSQESSAESKGESSTDSSTKPSTDKPTTPTNPPTISPDIDSILTPPPSKIQASIKVINAIDSLRQYLQSLR